MRIHCPNCHAVYEVGPLIKNAVLVCHRCDTEFTSDAQPISAEEQQKIVTGKLPLFEAPHSDKGAASEITEEAVSVTQKAEEAEAEQLEPEHPITPRDELLSRDEQQDEIGDDTNREAPLAAEDSPMSVPRRKKSRIWPWLAMMLLLLGSGGFYFKQDVWLSHPWVRSLLINSNVDVPLRNEDWSIVSDSVQGQWITRQDNSRILLIEGRVENRLFCNMTPPKILVRFYLPGSDKVISEQLMQITEPPTVQQIQQSPFKAPPVDRVPVESQGSRGFMLVFDELPEGANNFELSPIATAR